MKNALLLLFVSALMPLLCSFAGSPVASFRPEGPQAVGSLLPGGAYLVFAEKYGGEITKEQLEKQRELGVDGCARGSRIFSFTLEITRSGKTASFSAKSNVLTAEMIAGLKALQAGDTFEFKSTKAYLPNGKDVVDVHSRQFVVV